MLSLHIYLFTRHGLALGTEEPKKRNGQLLCKYCKSPAVQNILREGIVNVTCTDNNKKKT